MSSVEFKEIMRFRKLWQMKIEIGSYEDQNALDNVEIPGGHSHIGSH